MSCVHPHYDDNIVDLNGNPLPIPCGHCLSCRLDFQKQAIDRMYCAWKSYDVSAFVTFTYSDKNLRYTPGFLQPTLSKDDVHLYLDRIKHLKNLPKFDYYICGEYGDKFNRPHYHGLFFGLDYQLHERFFIDSWKLGLVQVLPCSPSAFRYVSKYITKSGTDRDDNLYFDLGLTPPFRKMSRGLGLHQYLLHLDEIKEQGFFILDSRKITVPRYYFIKLCHFNDRLKLKREQSLVDTNRRLSEEAVFYKLPVDVYKNMLADNKESGLLSKLVKQTSKAY